MESVNPVSREATSRGVCLVRQRIEACNSRSSQATQSAACPTSRGNSPRWVNRITWTPFIIFGLKWLAIKAHIFINVITELDHKYSQYMPQLLLSSTASLFTPFQPSSDFASPDEVTLAPFCELASSLLLELDSLLAQRCDAEQSTLMDRVHNSPSSKASP